ncbi:MAG: hypothetical protein DRN15_11445 [Thermoprotei archaeon]|nr:MAG: hypothetical protein DRN15_11445 [Thermoprotei archaeon]
MKESELRRRLKELVSSLKGEVLGLVKVVAEEDLGGSEQYKEIISSYFNIEDLVFVPTPDLVLVFEGYDTVDGWELIAIELKSIQSGEVKKVKKKMRQAFREIGQPLRYYLLGYDVAILWHVFDEDIEDSLIQRYVSLIEETLEKLKLCMRYYATKMTKEGKFILVSKYHTSKVELKYLIRWFSDVMRYCRNPLIYDEERRDHVVLKRREAIKLLMKIPGRRV